MRRPIFIELVSTDDYGMAETAVMIGDRTLGYFGHSRYVSTTESEAEDAIANVFERLLHEEPGLDKRSRFDRVHDEDDE